MFFLNHHAVNRPPSSISFLAYCVHTRQQLNQNTALGPDETSGARFSKNLRKNPKFSV